MSTIKQPKDKKFSENWDVSIYGGRDEIPDSFNFSDDKKKRKKILQGYETHYIYTDENGNTAFIVARKKDEETGKKSFLLPTQIKKFQTINSCRC